MKDIKCPLCGVSLQFFPDLHEIAMGRIGCPNCDWTTLLGFEETVWEEAEKIVSKFPPIMRLRQGDNVLVWLSDDIHTVLGTDLASGKIHLQDVYGDADSYDPTGIKKWPWELERKGGE